MSKSNVFNDNEEDPAVDDASPSTKLARRRKIEDMHEEKRLREELNDYEIQL